MKQHKRSNNKINKHKVFGNKISEIAICMLICLTASACGQNTAPEENTDVTEDSLDVDTQETDANAEKESADADSTNEDIAESVNTDGQQAIAENQTPARRIEVVPANKANIFKREDEVGREITVEEMQYFSEFVQTGNNYGFLMSAYDTPADVNLGEICFNGLGEASQHGISEEEREAYKKTVEWGEIYTDFFRITTAELNDYLLETTGLSYEQMNHPLGWTYLPEYDAYYSDHGDTNYTSFSCNGGYTVDEKFFVLRMTGNRELVLEKCGDTYQFRSNRQMLGDGIIEEQSFTVNLSPIGEVTFLSYEPDVEKDPLADVSFSIMQDGWWVCHLGSVFKDNIRANEEFQKIESVAFADYDEDGITDIIMILDYDFASGPNAAETHSEVRIYKGEYREYSVGDYFYYQRYQPELSESLTAKFSEPTIRGVLDYIAIIS